MNVKQKKKREQPHLNCELVIRCRPTSNPRTVHHGLYCREHGTWFKWLGARELAQYQSLGVGKE